MSFSLFFLRMLSTCAGLFGLATNTLNTWNASNWMLRASSLSRFIIRQRFSTPPMYRIMLATFARSSRSSPSSFRLCRRVT